MAVRCFHHVLPHAKDAHRPHGLVNNISAMGIGRLVVVAGDARLARVVRLPLPRVRRPFKTRAGRAPGDRIRGRGVAPEIEIRVAGCLDSRATVPLGLRNGIPLLALDVAEGFLGVKDPRIGGGRNGIDQLDLAVGVVVELGSYHVRRRTGRDELGVRGTCDHVHVGTSVVDFQSGGHDTFLDVGILVVLGIRSGRPQKLLERVSAARGLGCHIGIRSVQKILAITFCCCGSRSGK